MAEGETVSPRLPATRRSFEADLMREILGGVYAPGARLPGERVLSARSGLSRPLVREVLRALAERGMVTIVPARGVFVTPPDVLQLAGAAGPAARRHGSTPRDLVDAREIIEAHAARRAATRATEAEIGELRALVRAFDEAPSVIERSQCDLAFHASIARLSGNPVLAILFGAIAPLVLDIQVRSLADEAVARRGVPLHGDIVDAIAARDPETAAKKMSEHILLALDTYGRDLDVPLSELAVGRLEGILGEQRDLRDVVDGALAAYRESWPTERAPLTPRM